MLLIIAGSIALGRAMGLSGLVAHIGHTVRHLFGSAPTLMLAAIFGLAMHAGMRNNRKSPSRTHVAHCVGPSKRSQRIVHAFCGRRDACNQHRSRNADWFPHKPHGLRAGRLASLR